MPLSITKAMRLVGLVLVGLLWASTVQAQLWSGIIHPDRATNWQANQPGVVGGILARTTICTTLNPGATAASINSAIASCPSEQVVKLNAGTYNLSTGLIFNAKSNVTLRGAGPDQTFLFFSGNNSCGGLFSRICVMGNSGWNGNFSGGPVNWTAGYSQGTTVLTLSSVAGLSVGQQIILDQLDDSADTGGLWVNDTLGAASIEGACLSRAGRCQQQHVGITAINGTQVTITPGLYATNWRTGQSPQVWWTGIYDSFDGIEDLSIDDTAGSQTAIIGFNNATSSWVKNVRTINGARAHVAMPNSTHIEVRDSYFYGTQSAASQSYGTESTETSDALVINNISQHVTSPSMTGNNSGSVFAYNYTTDCFVNNPTFMSTCMYGSHDAGTYMLLYEGNDTNAIAWDTFHGAGGNTSTLFRNRLTGWEPGKTGGTLPIIIWANNRGQNIIGNVLGRSGYHTTYGDTTGSCTATATSIYTLGTAAWAGCDYQGVEHDDMVATSLMRWGNYDVASGAPRFLASEVPTTGMTFVNGNAVPATQTLPNSFFLSGQPSFWVTSFGTPAWPPIGPDVTGGNISEGSGAEAGLDGHAYKIPARLCYENTSQTNGILNFNANNCYVGDTQPPAAPTNLRVSMNK